jgi:hypothetical protein
LLSDQALTPENLGRFKLIVLANVSCLSDAQCDAIRAYVAQGGSVVAAYETSLKTETGTARSEFGLADVLGASFVSGPRGIVKNNYVALDGAHPVNAGYEGAARIMGGTRLMAVEPASGATTPFLFVPDFPDLPMEEVYPREDPKGAAVVARETGAGGRVVYIPWNIGEIFWEVMAVDHGRLIKNAVLWALGKKPDVVLEGPGVVDIAVRENAEGVAVAIFNLTNPMMMKGPVRESIPLGRQHLSVALPAGTRGATARLIIADVETAMTIKDGRAVLDIPGIDRIEVVHVAWT